MKTVIHNHPGLKDPNRLFQRSFIMIYIFGCRFFAVYKEKKR